MDTQRIVITGGPGSGKTALVNFLEKEGYSVLHEISRDVTLQAQKEGIEQLFLENPILFSEKLLEGRLAQFYQAQDNPAPLLFYDRGMPDVIAYMDFVGTHYPEHFTQTCLSHRYDHVFLLPPWEDIYQQDNERYESFEQAEKIFHFLRDSYVNCGYEVLEIPPAPVAERVDFLLHKLKHLF